MMSESTGELRTASSPLSNHDLMERACAAVSRSYSREAESQDDWTRAVASDLRELIPGPLGVMAIIAQWNDAQSTWETVSLGLAGDYPEVAVRALETQAQSGWPDDDFSRAVGHAGPKPGAFCGPRSKLRDDAGWQQSTYARFRASIGVHDFARAGVPFMDPRGTRIMILQVDGVTPDWTPPTQVLSTLACIMHPALEAYRTRFVNQRMARAELLDQLSPTQRRIVPMLAEGLTEAQIAEQIHRSAHTVHDHTRSIYRTLGVSSRLELRDMWLGR